MKFQMQFRRRCDWPPGQEVKSGIRDDTGKIFTFEGAAFVDEVRFVNNASIVTCTIYPNITPTENAISSFSSMKLASALHLLSSLVENSDGQVRSDEEPPSSKEVFASDVLYGISDILREKPELTTNEVVAWITELNFLTGVALGMPISPPTAPDIPRTLTLLSKVENFVNEHFPDAEIVAAELSIPLTIFPASGEPVYFPSAALDDLQLTIDPGSATSEEIAEILADISRIYKKVGGSGVTFRYEGATVTEVEKA